MGISGAQIQYVPKEKLQMHPRNMRLILEEESVRELAESIRECGLIHPLVGVPSGNGRGDIIVVVGNRRLRAVQLLGDDAPPVPIIIREDLDEKAQFEMMAVENIQRVDVDPISEGLHYRRLIDEFGTTKNEMARRMGVSVGHINNRLNLLELQLPVQRLIARGELPIGAGQHLLTIDDPKLQGDVAHRLALLGGYSLKQIEEIVQEVRGRKGKDCPSPPVRKSERKGLSRLAEALRDAELGADITEEGLVKLRNKAIPFSQLNVALQATCAACLVADISTDVRWGDLLDAGQRTCAECGLDYLKDACEQCPLVELLSHLRVLTGRQGK